MAVPTFVGAGSGVTITTGTATVSKTGCTANNLIFLHFISDGTAQDYSRGNRVNMLNLAGNVGDDNLINGAGIGLTAVSTHNIFVTRVTADGTCSVDLTVGASGEDLFARLYEFSLVFAGTTLNQIREAQSDVSANATTTLDNTPVTTTASDRLACNFIGVNSTTSVASFTGETGGDWTMAVTEYQGGGTIGTIALQTAAMPTVGTITGGTATITSGATGNVGFALIPSILSSATVAWITA